MDLALESFILLVASLLLLSIFTSKVAVRFGIPILALFLFIGMGMGSEGIGGIEFDYPQLTQTVGIIALIFILFSGGLDTEWTNIQQAMPISLSLATVGVMLTALLMGIFAQIALGFGLAEGILLGATMASTDAAAVFSILSGKSGQLKQSLKSILELESGSNDPMAVFLTLGMLELLTHPEQSIASLIPLFFVQMFVGGVVGVGSSYLIRYVINRIRLEYDGLYSVLSIACVLSVYSLTSVLGGNGFLAIYLAGLLLGRQDFIHKTSLMNFHDGLAWLMQISMFLVLGLQVFPSRLIEVAPAGLLTAAMLILVARPVSVFLLTAPTAITKNEKLFLSWVGLRGAAPIILATFTQLSAIDLPLPIFELVFFVVLVSVFLQGTTIIKVADRLALLPPAVDEKPATSSINREQLSDYLLHVSVTAEASVVGQQVLDLTLPEETLLVAISRASQVIVPRGSTILQPDDEILILTQENHHASLRQLFTEPTYSAESTLI